MDRAARCVDHIIISSHRDPLSMIDRAAQSMDFAARSNYNRANNVDGWLAACVCVAINS